MIGVPFTPCGFARLGRSGHEDVQATGHRRTQEARRLRSEHAQFDEMLKPGCLRDELADVDGPMAAGDIRNHHVQP